MSKVQPLISNPLPARSRWTARDSRLALRLTGIGILGGAAMWVLSLGIVSAILALLPITHHDTIAAAARTAAITPSGIGFLAALIGGFVLFVFVAARLADIYAARNAA